MAPRAPIFVRPNNRVKLSGEYFQTKRVRSLILFRAGLLLHLCSLIIADVGRGLQLTLIRYADWFRFLEQITYTRSTVG